MKKIILLIIFATSLFAVAFADPWKLFLLFDDEDKTPPSIPLNLLAVGGAEKITITSDVTTAADFLRWVLYRSDTNDSTTVAVIDSGITTSISKVDTPLTQQDSFYYFAKFVDKTGNRSYYSAVAWDTVKNIQYTFDFDGSTEYLSKTSPISLDLNGTERVTDTLNAGFGVGTEVITNGSFGSNITGWSVSNSVAFWYNTDWNAVSRVNALLDSATTTSSNTVSFPTTFVNGVRYKITYTYYIPSTNTGTVQIAPRFIGGSNPYLTVRATLNAWTTVTEYHTAAAAYTSIAFYHLNSGGSASSITVGDKIYIDDVSIKPVPYWATNGTHSIDTSSTQKYAGSYSGRVISTAVGDTTTNFISLASSNFTTLEAGKKYTVEYQADAVGSQGANIVPDSNSSFTTWGLSYWLIDNGTFTHNDSGWGIINSTTTAYLYKGSIMTSGLSYQVSFSAKSAGYRNKIFTYGGSSTGAFYSSNLTSSWQHFSGIVMATGATFYIQLISSYSGTVDIDSIKIQLITKPTITAKIGSKQWTSDTLSIIPGVFEKVVYNFQATSAEVNTPIKFYLSQADTCYIDNFSITEAKDVLMLAWIKQTSVGTDYFLAKTTAFSLYAASSTIRTTLGDGTTAVTKNHGTAINTSDYYLVTLTIDRVNGAYIYLNTLASSVLSLSSLGKINSAGSLVIGSYTGGASDDWTGNIGEVQIATFSDISTLNYTPAQIYYRSKSGYYFPTAYTGGTVVGHWTWEGADIDASLTDKSGTGNTLTGTNITVTGDRVTVSGY